MSIDNSYHGLCVVVIDDDDSHREIIARSVEAAFSDDVIEIYKYRDANEALVELPTASRVVILCDYQLGGASGVDWLPDFVRTDIGPVIIVTSSGDERIAAAAFRGGAADYVEKANIFQKPEELRKTIAEALRRFKLERANRDLAWKLKSANKALEQKNETLSRMTATAHRFVDDVAHEFRTPLTVIKEFASILADGIGGEVNVTQSEYLLFINDAARDLAHLIDSFLDSGKLRAGALRVDRREHSVEELLELAWPMLQSRSASKDIQLVKEIAGSLPSVFVDADMVTRTLINLVVNAIKFSNPGGTVTVSAKQSAVHGVEISVKDEGPGLPEEEIAGLFERFKQGVDSRSIGGKGFGLGLSIVKELVGLNFGEMSVASVHGEGCTFTFSLCPFDRAVILETFRQMTMRANPGAAVSAITVRRVQDQRASDELRTFLSSVCYPTDIHMAASDDRSLVLIGETAEPDRWRAKLLRLDEASRKHLETEDPGPIEIDIVGTWPVRDACEKIYELVQHPSEDHAHA